MATSPTDSSTATTEREAHRREAILDAAAECFRRFGPAATTMDDVASGAAVSRATLYRYFANRDAVVLGVAARDVDSYLADLGAELADHPAPHEALVELCVRIIAAARRDQSLALLFGRDTVSLRSSAAAFDLLYGQTAQMLEPLIAQWQAGGHLRADVTAAEATEWLLRIVTSFLSVETAPRRRGDDLRAYVETFLVPSLADPDETK